MRVALLSLILAAALATSAEAQDVREVQLSGKRASKAIRKTLQGLQWTNDLDALREQATAQRKLIFWVQIVGELDDGL